MSESVAAVDGLRKELLSDQVHQRLRQAILRHELAPGERLVESEIARQYSISQAPVRDAIHRLAHEGLVTHIKRRGSYVASTSPEEADSARQVRAVIEELAARLCAGSLPAGTVTDLQNEVDRMRSAVADNDPVRQRVADLAFHRLVCQASGNSFIPKMWDVIESSLYHLFAIADPFAELDAGTMADWHQELLSALVSGTPAQAAAAFAAHARGDGPLP